MHDHEPCSLILLSPLLSPSVISQAALTLPSWSWTCQLEACCHSPGVRDHLQHAATWLGVGSTLSNHQQHALHVPSSSIYCIHAVSLSLSGSTAALPSLENTCIPDAGSVLDKSPEHAGCQHPISPPIPSYACVSPKLFRFAWH